MFLLLLLLEYFAIYYIVFYNYAKVILISLFANSVLQKLHFFYFLRLHRLRCAIMQMCSRSIVK
ncbi:hypothetical protein HMPREF0673_00646 [Leyella stercorea DSM 18206]|uniref:Uncharacterized protein n=1 Tax=Leyella stercorea DSM 18206 TaxID=1002367 RepID=G6AVL1_9BACT|nr:hypothetical protein HMPREF0673_00646 [Leyella stercorea DSM 18206]